MTIKRGIDLFAKRFAEVHRLQAEIRRCHVLPLGPATQVGSARDEARADLIRGRRQNAVRDQHLTLGGLRKKAPLHHRAS